MADVAGLVLGVVTTWKTCVEVFDIIDSGRKYGMDYEVLRVKLEVERIRLLMWGNAVGLGSAGAVTSRPDGRLHRDEVRDTVMRLLGCIHHVFEHSDKLQDSYGLRPATPVQASLVAGQPAQTQLILGSVFKRAYDVLRTSAKDRQRETPLHKKTLWAVHDRKKFQQMVIDVKGFNDNLESLFPEAKLDMTHQMIDDIEDSEDIGALMSLQEAAQAEHEMISDCASIRLETLGVTATARSQISDAHTEIGEPSSALENIAEVADALKDDDDAKSDATEEVARAEGIPVALVRELKAVEAYSEKKSEGCLTLGLIGPHNYTARVTAHTYWGGKTNDAFSSWDERLQGFVKTGHASFGTEFRSKHCATMNADNEQTSIRGKSTWPKEKANTTILTKTTSCLMSSPTPSTKTKTQGL